MAANILIKFENSLNKRANSAQKTNFYLFKGHNSKIPKSMWLIIVYRTWSRYHGSAILMSFDDDPFELKSRQA